MALVRVILFFIAVPALLADFPVLHITFAERAVAFTAGQLTELPRSEITTTEPHSGKRHSYSGVAVRELLLRAGAPLGEKLRGGALQLAVLVRCRDGYAVAFALAEFDDSFNDRAILLADAEDGVPLKGNAGPFRLVIPGDKRGARWARSVVSVEVVPVPASPGSRSK